MKALLTAFALLSFVAASSLPMAASAEDMKGDQTMAKPDTDKSMSDKGKTDQTGKSATAKHKTPHKTVHKTTHKKTTKKTTHHKHTAKKKAPPKDVKTTPKDG